MKLLNWTLLFSLLLMTIYPASADEEETSPGIFYFGQGMGRAIETNIEFDVRSKNNRERATLSEDDNREIMFGYKKGRLRTEFSFLWDAPNVQDIYYVNYNGRTMDLYEINQRFSISGEIQTVNYVGSVWYNVLDNDGWDLYAGAGLGRGHTTLDYTVKLEGVFESSNEGAASMDWTYTQQIGAGISLNLFNRGELDVGYRMLRFGRGDFGSIKTLHLEPRIRHRVMAGLKFFLFGN